jgi:hypothetical protein
MPKAKDYLPRRQGDFNVWQDNFVTRIAAGAVAWLIANSKVLLLQGAQNAYVPLYNAIKVKQNRTTGQVDAHKVGLKVYKSYLRTFVKENVVGNTAIPHEDKKALGINPGRDGKGSRPAIKTAPNVVLKAKGGLVIEVECRVESDSSRPSMHEDADVIEFRIAVSSTPPGGNGVVPPAPGPGDTPPPANYLQATDVFTSKKARFSKTFDDPTLSGKYLYAFARYKNLSDEKKSGPWSEVAHVRIA